MEPIQLAGRQAWHLSSGRAGSAGGRGSAQGLMSQVSGEFSDQFMHMPSGIWSSVNIPFLLALTSCKTGSSLPALKSNFRRECGRKCEGDPGKHRREINLVVEI